MGSLFLWLFEQIGLAALNRWWGGITKPDAQVEVDHALEAKDKEAEALATPDRSKSDVIASLRSHEIH
jgi:hypothetical protein